VYLVTTADGLLNETAQLMTADSASGSRGADLIVLCYKKKCNATGTPRTSFIYSPGSTWTSARNELLAAAMRQASYEYFIFSDGDVVIFKTIRKDGKGLVEFGLTPGLNDKNVYKMFEKYLSHFQPAVGVPLFASWYFGRLPDVLPRAGKTIISHGKSVVQRKSRRAWSTIKGKRASFQESGMEVVSRRPWTKPTEAPHMGSSNPPRPDDEINSIFQYDALCNAFRYDALSFILPYAEINDRVSWWDSQYFLYGLTQVFYPNKVMQVRSLSCINPSHEDYPKPSPDGTMLPLFGLPSDMLRQFFQVRPT
jgi:hypothetical protein